MKPETWLEIILQSWVWPRKKIPSIWKAALSELNSRRQHPGEPTPCTSWWEKIISQEHRKEWGIPCISWWGKIISQEHGKEWGIAGTSGSGWENTSDPGSRCCQCCCGDSYSGHLVPLFTTLFRLPFRDSFLSRRLHNIIQGHFLDLTWCNSWRKV